MNKKYKRKPTNAFGSLICRARIKRGMTQQELAEIAEISIRWYQKIESGQSKPNFILAIHLMAILEITPTAFTEEVGLNVPVHLY